MDNAASEAKHAGKTSGENSATNQPILRSIPLSQGGQEDPGVGLALCSARTQHGSPGVGRPTLLGSLRDDRGGDFRLGRDLDALAQH